jgi:hypothetical protein
VNRNSGKCMGVTGGSAQNGAAVVQWDCNGHPDQRWFGKRPRFRSRDLGFAPLSSLTVRANCETVNLRAAEPAYAIASRLMVSQAGGAQASP